MSSRTPTAIQYSIFETIFGRAAGCRSGSETPSRPSTGFAAPTSSPISGPPTRPKPATLWRTTAAPPRPWYGGQHPILSLRPARSCSTRIGFRAAHAAGAKNRRAARFGRLASRGGGAAKKDKPLPKGLAEPMIARAAAAEIRRLTAAASNRSPPEDIAVLVRTNGQARSVKQALSRMPGSPRWSAAPAAFSTRPRREEIQRVL